jgi:guanine nucleotide-binding protein G(i) subunit alpha
MALSCSVFIDAHRITSKDYIPSNDDVLRAPVPVLTDIYFPLGQLSLRLYHVSQRSERKKWIHFFAGVTSIIFCASLADYNRFTYEQGRIMRSFRLDVPDSNLQIQIPLLAESLVLFESVINSRWFVRTSIILFLTRINEFKVKLPQVRYNLIHVLLLPTFLFISSVSISKLLPRVYRGRGC